MRRRIPPHSERVLVRKTINGAAYPDNPYRLPFDNKGRLNAKSRLTKCDNSHVPGRSSKGAHYE